MDRPFSCSPKLLGLWIFLLSPTEILATPAPLAPQGDDFQVNTYTTGIQSLPSANWFDEGFVVTWTSTRALGDTDSTSVQGQRFASDGTPLGNQFQINDFTTGAQSQTEVATWPDGRFVVVWESGPQPDRDIRGRLFQADGSPNGGEFQINTYTSGAQYQAQVAVADDETFVVIWTSEGSVGPDGDQTSVQGHRFDASGGTLGSQFQVNTYTTANQFEPAVETLADSDFVVTWISEGSPTFTNYNNRLQRFASDGHPVGVEFQVSTTPYDTYGVDVSASSDGAFVIAWASYVSPGPTTTYFDIFARQFDSGGAAVGGEFQINAYTTGYQGGASVASDPLGAFLVTWGTPSTMADPSSGLVGRRIGADQMPLSGEFQVNTTTNGYQGQGQVAGGPLGDFAVVWSSDTSSGNDSNEESIQARLYRTEADLEVTLSDGSTTAVPGGVVIYDLGVTNLGPDPALAATLTDVLPADLDCTWTSLASGGASGNSAAGSGDLLENLVLPVAAQVVYELTCQIEASATGTLNHTATISTPLLDAVAGNDSATDENTLVPDADLALTKIPSDRSLVSGDTVTYTFTVQNLGPSTSTGGLVTDTLPANLSFVSSGECTEIKAFVSCAFGPLLPGATVQASFLAQTPMGLPDGTQILNTANLNGNEDDSVAANDTAMSTVTIETPFFADGFESGDTSAWSNQVP